jgi:hypothetical protein
MSVLSQFTGSVKLRYQEFLSTGTFTPSAKLLANGGQVEVFMVGGGAGGGSSNAGSFTGGGGGGGQVIDWFPGYLLWSSYRNHRGLRSICYGR